MQHDFILLDRSGSMVTSGRWQESLSAINAYVADLVKRNVDTGVTLAVFVTPLNDAVCRLVTHANQGIGGQQYDKVAIIIVTDGAENASVEDPTGVQARKMLDECRAKDWQVLFFGADFSQVVQQGATLGSDRRFSVPVAAASMSAALRNTSQKRAAYAVAASGAATMDFSDEEERTKLAPKS